MVQIAQAVFLTLMFAYVLNREIEPLYWQYVANRGGSPSSPDPVPLSGKCKNDVLTRVPQAVTLMDIAFPWKNEEPMDAEGVYPWHKAHAEGWEPKLAPVAQQKKKWIVITSINEPTEQIQDWAKLHQEWVLLVVGDKKSPKEFNQPNCVFLAWQDQMDLGFKTASALPWNSYSRKMVGYLYAIKNGAEVIYETDDDNGYKPSMPLTNFLPENAQVLTFKADPSKKVLNPYKHFGIGSMWPRGYPINAGLEKGIDADAELFYQSPMPATRFVPIQQALADLDPDVDAIFRLTRANELGSFVFDASAKPVSYPAGTMSPYNTQNTVHYRSAFALLFIPGSVAMRVCDIWRSYWAQRLLWELGGEVAFLPASVDQVRSAHDFLGDFLEEVQMYTQAGKFVSYLRAWACTRGTLFDCALQLTHDMAVEGFWGATDVVIMEAWLSDLYELGIPNPVVQGLYTPIAVEQGATITTMTGLKV
jgi:hypothetical protein